MEFCHFQRTFTYYSSFDYPNNLQKQVGKQMVREINTRTFHKVREEALQSRFWVASWLSG